QKETKRTKEWKDYLGGILIFLLIISTFFWYAQLTESSSNLIDLTSKTTKNIFGIFNEDLKGEGASFSSQWNLFYKPKDQTTSLKDYVEDTKLRYENKSYIIPYKLNRYENYKPKVIYPTTISLKTDLNIVSKTYFFMEIIKKLVKIFMILGVLYLLFFQLKKKESDSKYIILALVSLFLLVAIISLPFTTLNYDLERAYQQILIILSLPAVFGGILAFKFFKKDNLKILLVCLIFILYFLSYSGFIQ
ncbi:unnamed protein product, partial [marine sediment metagenome]